MIRFHTVITLRDEYIVVDVEVVIWLFSTFGPAGAGDAVGDS